MEYTYKIGDVSEMLNMSSEMVRYYEKCGAIHPARNDNNQYREYCLNDIFELTECLHYKSWGIKISDIADTIHNNSSDYLLKGMTDYKEELDKTVQFLSLKSLRIHQIIDFQNTFRFNLGNYWVKNIEKKYVFEFSNGTNEHFNESKITINKMFSKELFSNDNIIFFDACVELNGKHMKWNFVIDVDFYHKLDFRNNSQAHTEQPEQACLCTIIYVDSFENLGMHCFQPAIQYAKEKGYKVNGDIRGVLVGRGYTERGFCRYFEVQIPIAI